MTGLDGFPVITTQPEDQTVNAGQNATFTIAATPPLSLSYQWRFNQQNITGAGATNSTLVVTNAQLANEGDYQVVVTTSEDALFSGVARLTINTPPRITQQPQSRTVFKGEDVTFSVEAVGPRPFDYQWWFNQTNRIDGATNATLNLRNVQLAGAGTYAVVVSNALGSVTSSNAVLTVFEPRNANLVGQWPRYARGPAVCVVLHGQFAYVAADTGGLIILDLSNLASPQRVGGYDTSGTAYGVAVSGNYAYVADYDAGLQVIEISNPASPQRVGGYDTSGSALGVSVSGNYAYVADGGAGLQVIDISNPASPQRVGGYDTSGSAWGVAVLGNYAYVADYDAGLQVIDISNPASPQRVGGYDTSGETRAVAVSGNYAYVADGSWGLAVLRLGESAGPPALRFRDSTIAGGKFQVQVVGAPGQTIVIEASSDLRNWAPLRTNTLSTLGVMDLIEPLGPNLNQRFYRLQAR